MQADFEDEVVADSEDEYAAYDNGNKSRISDFSNPVTASLGRALPHTEPISTLATDIAIKGFSSDFPSSGIQNSSIADRAKLRSRVSDISSSRVSLEVIDLSDSEDEIKLKPVRKPKAKPKEKASRNGGMVDIVAPPETIPSVSRPRPRPRPIPSKKQLEQTASSSSIGIPATSLPPSDPPVPSSTLPSIAILENPSSSLRATSIPAAAENPVDELDDYGAHASTSANFFAPSSSDQLLNATDSLFSPVPAKTKNAKSKSTHSTGDTEKKKRKSKATDAAQTDSMGTDKKGKKRSKDVEIYKSKEFINDEVDDEDPTNIQSPIPAPSKKKRKSTVIQSDEEDSYLSNHRPPPKMAKNIDAFSREPSEEVNVVIPLPIQTPAPTSRTQKKRKSAVIQSDDELDSYLPDQASSPKKARKASKGQKKDKGHTILPGGDGDSEIEKTKPKPAPKGRAKKGKKRDLEDSTLLAVASEESSITPPIEEDVPMNDVAVEGTDLFKENLNPVHDADTSMSEPPMETPSKPQPSTLTSRYSIGPRIKSTPMSELIRRANSMPGSPFRSPAPRTISGTAYSPYIKASRSTLSRIAPLHPNRRTPPPVPPPPPPPKKTKKQLELEEKWEDELVEEAGGMTEWSCMTDAERKEARRLKRQRETAGWED